VCALIARLGFPHVVPSVGASRFSASSFSERNKIVFLVIRKELNKTRHLVSIWVSNYDTCLECALVSDQITQQA